MSNKLCEVCNDVAATIDDELCGFCYRAMHAVPEECEVDEDGFWSYPAPSDEEE